MCLSYDRSATEKLIEDCKKSGDKYIVCYKTILYFAGTITSQFYPHKWTSGWNYARDDFGNSLDPKNDYITKDTSLNLGYTRLTIEEGIHVFRNKPMGYPTNNVYVLPVRCYLKDILGSNIYLGEATFRKVWVDKSEIGKIVEDKQCV